MIIEYDSDNKTIKSFKDGAGKSVTYSKNSSGYITKMTDPAGKTITYSYTGNKLTKITYSNGTYITFTYDSDGSITKVTDIDGYRIEITYSSSSSGKRVTAIQEYGTNGSAGQKSPLTGVSIIKLLSKPPVLMVITAQLTMLRQRISLTNMEEPYL